MLQEIDFLSAERSRLMSMVRELMVSNAALTEEINRLKKEYEHETDNVHSQSE